MRAVVFGGLALMLASGPAFAAQATSADDTPPGWLKQPTARDIMAVYPKEALAVGRSGKAVIHCMVSPEGTLFDCKVVSEEPAGQHFGAAALALAPQLLMKPARLHGQPVVSGVNIPINFKSDGAGDWRTLQDAPPVASATMVWREAPSVAEVAAAYPQKARAKGVGGFVSLSCRLGGDGDLGECQTLREEPRGLGFAQAARKLTRHFRAPARTSDGKPINGTEVNVPFAFTPEMLNDRLAVVGKPHWAALPDGPAFAAVFKGSNPAITSIRVVLGCEVEQGGGVGDCKVVREDPAGQGFGQKALALAGGFKLSTWSDEGLPVVGGTVEIPLRYALDPVAAAGPPGAPAKP